MKVAVLVLSGLGTLLVWLRLFQWKAHLALKALIAIVAMFPVVGPIMCLWIVGMPDRAHPLLRATMNHYGRGGRFIGFGSGRFDYGDSPGTVEDWKPTVPELLAKQKRDEK